MIFLLDKLFAYFAYSSVILQTLSVSSLSPIFSNIHYTYKRANTSIAYLSFCFPISHTSFLCRYFHGISRRTVTQSLCQSCQSQSIASDFLSRKQRNSASFRVSNAIEVDEDVARIFGQPLRTIRTSVTPPRSHRHCQRCGVATDAPKRGQG